MISEGNLTDMMRRSDEGRQGHPDLGLQVSLSEDVGKLLSEYRRLRSCLREARQLMRSIGKHSTDYEQRIDDWETQ